MQSRIHFCCQKQSSEDMLGEFTDSVDTSAVRDLREAAALSPELASVLQSYASATTKAEQTALLGELLNQWGATGNFNTSVERAQEQGFALRYFNSQGQDVTAWVELLETFNGATFVQVGGVACARVPLNYEDVMAAIGNARFIRALGAAYGDFPEYDSQ